MEERSARALRKPDKTHTRGATSPRGNARAVPRLLSPLRLVQSVQPRHSESGGPACGADRQPSRCGEDEHGDQRRAGRHSWTDGHHLHGNLCGRGAVAAALRSKGDIAHLAAFLMGQVPAWGLASGALVLTADQETSLTTLLDEIKARPWWKEQWWNRTSRWAQLSL